jgi:hypothetical protein
MPDLKFGGDADQPAGGARVASITSADSPYSPPSDVDIIFVDTTTAAVVINLPVAAEAKGRRLTAVKTSAGTNTVTLEGAGAETVQGAANYAFEDQYDHAEVVCNGTAWYILNRLAAD